MDIAAMKLAAEAATPGPWADVDNGAQIRTDGGKSLPIAEIWSNGSMIANAQFIAAANPKAVLELIASHERLLAALLYAKDRLELADENRFDKTTLRLINAAIKKATGRPA